MMHTGMRLARHGVLAGILFGGAGCFEYAHVPLDPMPVGHSVRALLSDSGFARLALASDGELPSLSRAIEGDLVRADSDSISLAVRVWSGGAGADNQLEQLLVIARRDVLEIEVKQLDRQKTAIVGAIAGAALAAFVVHELSGHFGGTTTGTGPPGPTEIRRP